MCSESTLRGGKKMTVWLKRNRAEKELKEEKKGEPSTSGHLSLSQHISTDEVAAVSGFFSSFWHHFL